MRLVINSYSTTILSTITGEKKEFFPYIITKVFHKKAKGKVLRYGLKFGLKLKAKLCKTSIRSGNKKD